METLLDWLVREFPNAKRQTLKRMVENGRVRINGVAARKLNLELSTADKVSLAQTRKQNKPSAPASLPFAIVHEDADILVISKPAGLLTSTVAHEKRPTAWAAVRSYLKRSEPAARPGLIHRLDRDASGLLVFSKNDEAYRSLKTQFFHHSVTRAYVAVVSGKINPPSGRIESLLVERADGTVRSTQDSKRGAQRAITVYETIAATKQRSLLRVTLLTGRKHQIRVHLAERGNAILGDAVYGDGDAGEGDGELMLAAIELQFDHPRTGKRVAFSEQISATFW